jgi:hypothetical protein
MEVGSSTEMGAPVPGSPATGLRRWVEAPRIWERETTDPKPTEADHDQSLHRKAVAIPVGEHPNLLQYVSCHRIGHCRVKAADHSINFSPSG